jgi:hypothetical protein
VIGAAGEIRHVQKAALFHSDVDECRLHAWKDGGYDSLVDVTDVPLFFLSVDEELAQLLVFDDCDTGFFGGYVDEDLALHESPAKRRNMAFGPLRQASRARKLPDASPHSTIERYSVPPGGAAVMAPCGSRTDGSERSARRASLDGSR